MFARISILVLAGSLLLFGLTSCGSGDATSTGILTPGVRPTNTPDVPASTRTINRLPPGSAVPNKIVVSIDNFVFSPQTLTIAKGTTVAWINHDDVPHTVRSAEMKFTSGTLDTDDSYSYTFAEPGTYEYFCTVHTHMTGTVIVK